ncbi:MAG: PqqD family protein [Paludibacteraceae bacterium]|nr:PqqD family protein [Paludibacteraceae bacterium]
MKLKYEFAVRDVCGSIAALAIGEGAKYYPNVISMNETGKDIFTCLQQGMDEDAIVKKMLTEYEVSEEQLRSEVKALVEKLRAEGLIID